MFISSRGQSETNKKIKKSSCALFYEKEKLHLALSVFDLEQVSAQLNTKRLATLPSSTTSFYITSHHIKANHITAFVI